MNQSKMHRVHALVRGVYAITPDEPDTAKLIVEVSEVLAGGVRLLQYRNKLASKILAREQALALRRLTTSADALLVINDDADLALAVSADGVHLGRDDGRIDGTPDDLRALRRRAFHSAPQQGQFLIGISCYDQMDRVKAAAAAGADYVALGSFFPSPTKPHAVRADVSLIDHAKREFSLPVVAIGGITMENAPQLVAAGADAVALISSLFDTDNIRSRAHYFSSLFLENV